MCGHGFLLRIETRAILLVPRFIQLGNRIGWPPEPNNDCLLRLCHIGSGCVGTVVCLCTHDAGWVEGAFRPVNAVIAVQPFHTNFTTLFCVHSLTQWVFAKSNVQYMENSNAGEYDWINRDAAHKKEPSGHCDGNHDHRTNLFSQVIPLALM